VEDACPHRLAPLSEGRIDEQGQIECPYHGWTFRGSDGECTRIPQMAADAGLTSSNPAACAKAYPTVEAQGLIFVWPQPLSSLPVGAIPSPRRL
jgi:pheophorbide a oxygenase